MTEITQLIKAGALFVINHSGGKDSQAMTACVRRLVPASQILVVHAILPEVEWAGTEEHARETSQGLEFVTCQAAKTLLGMVEARGHWPSPQFRQCTSDLKRGPIEKLIRRVLKERNLRLIVNCMGIRAEESSSRAKQVAFRKNERNSKAGREWYDWLPIFSWTKEEVFACISGAGQSPHWAYEKGMTRLSCCFCIMANKNDLRIAAEHNPDLYSRYVALEQKIGKTVFTKAGKPVSLPVYLKEGDRS